MPDHPFPQLRIHPSSGLSFPWSEYNPNVTSTSTGQLGPDGVGHAMQMLIQWYDLQRAVVEILGFSWRDSSTFQSSGYSTLRRKLPWQHAYWNNTFAKSITQIQGIRNEGHNLINMEDFFTQLGGQVGVGYGQNLGPFSEFRLALLTISFWRPPYVIRTDADIIDPQTGVQREWLRYVDRNWMIESDMLVREGGAFRWANCAPGGTKNSWLPEISQGVATANANFHGSVGQKIVHTRVKRTWYEIPEQGIFQSLTDDAAPNGLPYNLVYTRTPTKNPITSYIYPKGSPIVGCVNSPLGGGQFDIDPNNRFYGCFAGTLLLQHIEIRPRPLQFPGFLMLIPNFLGGDPAGPGERISQQQCDVTFHFDLFDPPRSPKMTAEFYPDGSSNPQTSIRGHNLCAWSGDGQWYPVTSQNAVGGSAIGLLIGTGIGANIASVDKTGAITSILVSYVAGTLYQASSNLLFVISQGSGEGGLVSIPVDAAGVPRADQASLVSAGISYTVGGTVLALAGVASTIYHYADFSDLFLLL